MPGYITGFTLNYADTLASAISGYTRATSIVGTVSVSSGIAPSTVLNDYSLIVSFGGREVAEITQITDNALITTPVTFDWPGVYEVKLTVAPKSGASATTFTSLFSAYNYLTDSLNWDYSFWPDLSAAALSAGAVFHGFQSCVPGDIGSSTPLAFNFTTSNIVSSDILFSLYSKGSLSQPWDIATYENKYALLRPRWRFTDTDGNIINTLTASDLSAVYITPQGTVTTDASGVLVGYTGTLEFYYIDDIPSLNYTSGNYSVTVPTVWVVYNTFAYPNYQDVNDVQAPSYSNSVVSLSSLFYVKNLSADHFNISLNGGIIPLPGTVWPCTSGDFIISVNSAILSSTLDAYSNKTLLNYPINYSNGTITISASPYQSITFSASSFNLSRTNSTGKDIGGFYKNSYYIMSKESDLLTSGSCSSTITINTSAITVIAEPAPSPVSGYNPNTRTAAASSSSAITTKALTGGTSLNIVDFDKTYFVRKINEDFNYGAQLQSYALMPTIAANDNLFAFLSAMAGDSYTTDETFGTKVYEKVSNFVLNTQDIQTGDVNSLYSLSNEIDNQFDDYNFTPPPTLKRAFDLFSTPHERLWGTREKYNINFNNAENHTNLGTALTAYDIRSTIVSAGQKIVLNDIFDSSFYELLEVPTINSYASVTAANMQSYLPLASYPVSSYPLTAYPLSAFFGWGVKTPVESYYKFWVYKGGYSNTPVNNLIDWNTKTDGLSTTLSESTSSIQEWYKDGGILENIYSYYITKGLDFFLNNCIVATTSPAIQPPAAPTNLTAIVSGASAIMLAWTDNATTETDYEIQRSIDGITFITLPLLAAGTTTFTDTGLTPSTTYTYRARARLGPLSSDFSNLVQAQTDTAGPYLALVGGGSIPSFTTAAIQPQYDGLSAYTIEFWAKQYDNTLGESDSRLLEYNRLAGGGWTVAQYLTSGYIYFASDVTNNNYVAFTQLSANKWTHIACVRNGLSAAIYQNGVLDKTETFATLASTVGNSIAVAVHGYSGSIKRSNAYITDIRYWNVARSQSDIVTYMNTHLPSSTPNLIGNWQYLSGASVSADSTIYNNPMVLSVSATFTNDTPFTVVSTTTPAPLPPVPLNYTAASSIVLGSETWTYNASLVAATSAYDGKNPSDGGTGRLYIATFDLYCVGGPICGAGMPGSGFNPSIAVNEVGGAGVGLADKQSRYYYLSGNDYTTYLSWTYLGNPINVAPGKFRIKLLKPDNP